MFNTDSSVLKAQQSNGAVASPERVDTNAFRTLFRQALAYKKLADDAEASPDSKLHFNQLLATRYRLNEDDNASLQRLAIAYQGEIDPIHKQVLEVIKKFHARIPDRVIQPGTDMSPPPELASLQQQEDAVTLRYRDLLRNSMREEVYQTFHARLLKDFGKVMKMD